VGVDLKRFHPISPEKKHLLRQQYGYSDSDFIILYIAEFIERKNHMYLLSRISDLRKTIPKLKIIFAGKGETLETCKTMVATMNAGSVVDFPGYRHDVEVICQIADLHVSPSRQEGLAVSNLEAMACGLPLVCSRIRGAVDVITEGRNGFLFGLDEPDKMVNLIITLYKSPELREIIARYNTADVQRFSVDTAVAKMADIYKQFM
jgi:glycosyltransferase EpsD